MLILKRKDVGKIELDNTCDSNIHYSPFHKCVIQNSWASFSSHWVTPAVSYLGWVGVASVMSVSDWPFIGEYVVCYEIAEESTVTGL